MISKMTLLRTLAVLVCCCCCVAATQEFAKIDYMTPHQEVGEGEAVHLQCLVTLTQNGVTPENINVIWQRRIITSSGNVAQEKLARNGRTETNMGRVVATVRQHRVGDKRTFEYGLLVKDLQKNLDEGMYDCQVDFIHFIHSIIRPFVNSFI